MIHTEYVNYLYLDDAQADESKTFSQSVERYTPNLTIEVKYPTDFSNQLDFLEQTMSAKQGLILDLRLDQQSNEIDGEAVKANYRAPALAQEIRTRAAESLGGEFPIVLWSFEKRLQESYSRDQTSQDLFDLTIKKERLKSENFARDIGIKLIALAEGYEEIERIRDSSKASTNWFYRLLGFTDPDDAIFLDTRILDHFGSPPVTDPKPAHEFAFFITRQLLSSPGPLIDERVLGARLGIDISASPDAAQLMFDFFGEARYKGVFANGWVCWWEYLIEKKWNEITNNKISLRNTDAGNRVKYIVDATGLKGLQEATPINPLYSTRYWTICQETQKPLDPKNGFLLTRRKAYPWQSEYFVSLEAFEEGNIDIHDIDPIDRQRLTRILKSHT